MMPGALAAEGPFPASLEHIQFDQLETEDMSRFDKKTITVRGFLYCVDGKCVLAASPNIKTCCVTNPEKQPHIYVQAGSNIPVDITRAVTLKGTFAFKQHNHYVLENAEMMEEADSHAQYYIALLVSLFIIIAGLYFALKSSRGKNKYD